MYNVSLSYNLYVLWYIYYALYIVQTDNLIALLKDFTMS